jgi:PIN domain nuclease of toxin-antitoxin system
MRYLLDTHTFLWVLTDQTRLPARVTQIIEDPSQEVFLSAISLWEIAIKLRSGRLDIGGRSATDVLNEARNMNLRVLSLDPEEASTHGSLTEDTHFDPFDRMLIWQAIDRDLTLVSRDREFKKFKTDGLRLLWK